MTSNHCVNYTPFAHLTEAELLGEVANRQDVSDLEIELALRLEKVLGELADLQEALG